MFPLAPRRARGFSLVEIAIVLVIIAVLAVTVGTTSVGMMEVRRREETRQNLDKVEAALVNYVATTRRLPCPADGALTSADANWGRELRTAPNTCDAMARGVVPWITLGITQADATDGWGTMFTFRMDNVLSTDAILNMSSCDPAGTNATSPATTCLPGCVGTDMSTCTPPTPYLTNKGLSVQNVAGAALANPAGSPPTGAAYVLISHGPTLGPGFNTSGTMVPNNAGIGIEEAKNANGLALGGYYVDDTLNATETAAHFDDIVRRPSVMTVISRANLGPRAH